MRESQSLLRTPEHITYSSRNKSESIRASPRRALALNQCIARRTHCCGAIQTPPRMRATRCHISFSGFAAEWHDRCLKRFAVRKEADGASETAYAIGENGPRKTRSQVPQHSNA